MKKPIKAEVISVYIPTALKKQAEIVARRQGRKLSQFIRWTVEREVNRELAGRQGMRQHMEALRQTNEYRDASPKERKHLEGSAVSLKLKPGLFED